MAQSTVEVNATRSLLRDAEYALGTAEARVGRLHEQLDAAKRCVPRESEKGTGGCAGR